MKRLGWFVLGTVLAVWPVTLVAHSLISAVTFILTGDPWNPLGLTMDRIFIAVIGAVPIALMSEACFEKWQRRG